MAGRSHPFGMKWSNIIAEVSEVPESALLNWSHLKRQTNEERQVINRKDTQHATNIEASQSVTALVTTIAQQDSGNQKTAQHEEQPYSQKAERDVVGGNITIDRQKMMGHHRQHCECS